MEPEKEERKISEKQIKIIVFVVMVVIVVSILVWGMVPSKIYEVSEVLENQTEFDGDLMSIKGLVRDWNFSNNFTLVDASDNNLTITINFDGGYPDGFTNNETVVVKGVFHAASSMDASAIQIGCPSKY